MQGSINAIFLEYAFKEGQIDDYELASLQYSNKGISLLNELKYEEAYHIFEKAYFLKSEIELATTLIQTGALILHMSDYKDLAHVELLCKLYRFKELGITEEDVMAENKPSAPEQLGFLDHYRDQFPKVYEMHLMRLVELSLLAGTAEYWFDSKDAEKGNRFLDRFEQQMQGIDEINRIAVDIESAYKTATFYYYERSNLRKAHEYLNRGLKILPTSHSLKYMKSSI